MKTKQFSCIELQHHGAEKIYKETKDLSIRDELIYWQKRTDELRKYQQAQIKEKQSDVNH